MLKETAKGRFELSRIVLDEDETRRLEELMERGNPGARERLEEAIARARERSCRSLDELLAAR